VRHVPFICLALALAALADAPVMAQFKGRGEAPAGRYGWLGSLAEGKAQARQSGKPLMVVIRCVP
jgi:hypothetical protein